ncbi:MAG: mannonate dehydratase [Acidobacteria bacterium]|nr:mannonate dehydratase [Acidobacteriota bacterium]MBI3426655.1 mannonate dehydratase [Acidobacteriota bacterium]
MKTTRRELLKATGVAALAPAVLSATQKGIWPPAETGAPKICLGVNPNADAALMRRVKQLGVDYVLMGGPLMPWTEADLRGRLNRFKAGGLTIINMMISGFPKTIYGKPGRDEEIEKVIQSIRAAGKAGLPVIEYNFYAHRIVEGYYEELGRAGAGMTAFDYDRIKDLPPLPDIGAWTLDQMWTHITYFLKAVVPEAEKAGVRLAQHPNDPPAPISRGSQQIMATLAGWKKLVDIVKSPHNGITFDCGVTRELGEDPVEVAKYFGARDCINHVHYRNVIVKEPYKKYAEVFLDEGQVNMFAVMKELVRLKYARGLYPEHPRALDYDRERTGGIIGQYAPVGGGGFGGEIYNVGYTRAMLQAVLAR